MYTYYTIEEKYLQAVDELAFGETPKGLKLLNEIISNDPLYTRAHFQLGKIYYYDIKDYQAAGYHFKTCAELEPTFPDIYAHYLELLVFLKMEKLVAGVAAKALTIPGVNAADVYQSLGLLAEHNKKWAGALQAYRQALMEVTDTKEKEGIEESIERVKQKTRLSNPYQYHFAE